jgi:hypothetical protein
MIALDRVRVADVTGSLVSVTLAAGAGVGSAIALSSGGGVAPVAGGLAALVALILLVMREEWAILGFYGAIVLLEEFLPELIVAERWDRSITRLYAGGIVVPGFYAIDALLGVLLAWLLLRAFVQRRGLPFAKDPLWLPLVLTAGSLGLSCLLSLSLFPDTATPEGYAYDDVEVGLDARIAAWVPYLQVKTWVYVYTTYALTRLFLRDESRIRLFLQAIAGAAAAVVAIGFYRLYAYRIIGHRSGSLFYDDATHFILILVVCFFVLAWSRRLFSARTVAWQALFAGGQFIILSLSYRRGSWVGAALCFTMLLFLVPRWFRARLALVGVLLLVGGGVVAILGGFGWATDLPPAYTQLDRRVSNIYRTALLYNLLHGTEFSLLGNGLRPLWNTPLVMGSFQFNFEMVHNLYYWFILRAGIVGVAILGYLFFAAFREAWRLRQHARAPWCAVAAETTALGFVLFLVLGWFHPVYGMTRFVVLLGTLFGFLMAVRQVNDSYTAPRALRPVPPPFAPHGVSP